MSVLTSNTESRHGFETDDPRLRAIAAKVEAGERLSFDDGVALYRTGDILAVGWMANAVRERMHGDMAYFNVNRHINPTNVCVASLPAVRLRAEEGRGRDVHHGAGRGVADGGLRATARRSRSSTSSAGCIPTCRWNILWT